MVEDTIRVLHQGDPNDTRFQFEVIKQLAESVKVNAETLRGVQENLVRMIERLARIEERETHEAVAGLTGRVAVLELDKARTEGGFRMLDLLKTWGPTLFSLFTLLYLLGRTVGVVPSPPTTVTKIETPTPSPPQGELRHPMIVPRNPNEGAER